MEMIGSVLLIIDSFPIVTFLACVENGDESIHRTPIVIKSLPKDR